MTDDDIGDAAFIAAASGDDIRNAIRDAEPSDAPAWLRGYNADCWAQGYNKGIKFARTFAAEVLRLRADARAKDAEIARLRVAIRAIGNLPDVDVDNRSWMARDALGETP